MNEFITKDSGKREDFATGSRRDTDEGKPRYELIPGGPLYRIAMLYSRGAVKYGDDNWQKGQPFRRTFASLLRHAFAWAMGDRTEDHIIAVAWNAFALAYFEDEVTAGRLPRELDNMGILPQEDTTNG